MPKREELQLIVNAKNRAKGILKNLQSSIIAIGGAYLGWQAGKTIISSMITDITEYEATMQSLHAVSKSTGRDMNDIYAAMKSQLGGVASRAVIASGFLKGMTTELNVAQVNDLTTAIRNASIAMGEDFQQQFPLIIKAIKQLNPAILDNIGVTVRLDKVNKRIRDGFYGMSREINEATQQHAIYTEIMKQTAKFAGQEEELLKTAKGAWQELKAVISDFNIEAGHLIGDGDLMASILKAASSAVRGFSESIAVASKEQNKFGTLLDLVALDKYGIYLIGLKVKQELMNRENERNAEILKFISDQVKTVTTETAGYSEELNTLIGELQDEQTELDNAAKAWLDYSEAMAKGMKPVSLAGAKINKEFQAAVEDSLNLYVKDTTDAEKYIAEQSTLIRKEGQDQILAGNKEMLAAYTADWEAAGKEVTTHIKTQWEKTKEALQPIFRHMADAYVTTIDRASYDAADMIVHAMEGTKVQFKDIFKQMYQDWFREFLSKVLRDIAIKIAMELAGVSGGGGGGGGGGGEGVVDWLLNAIFKPTAQHQPAPVVVNLHGFTPGDENRFVSDVVLPSIQRAADNKEINLVTVNNFNDIKLRTADGY